jgi:hypothetical protein
MLTGQLESLSAHIKEELLERGANKVGSANLHTAKHSYTGVGFRDASKGPPVWIHSSRVLKDPRT